MDDPSEQREQNSQQKPKKQKPRGRKPKPPRRSIEERNKLVTDNVALCFHLYKNLAEKFSRLRTLGEADSVGAGQLALIRAAEHWDETRGVKFCTYAGTAIKQSIFDAYVEYIGSIRVPKKAFSSTNLSEKARKAKNCKRFDPKHHEAIALPGKLFEDIELEERVRRLVGRLPKQMRFVICRRFWDGRTFTEIGIELGLSKQRAHQIFLGAVGELRKKMDA